MITLHAGRTACIVIRETNRADIINYIVKQQQLVEFV